MFMGFYRLVSTSPPPTASCCEPLEYANNRAPGWNDNDSARIKQPIHSSRAGEFQGRKEESGNNGLRILIHTRERPKVV